MALRYLLPVDSETLGSLPIEVTFKNLDRPACGLARVSADGTIGLIAGTFGSGPEVRYATSAANGPLAETAPLSQPTAPGLYLVIAAGVTSPRDLIAGPARSPSVDPSPGVVAIGHTRFGMIETMHLYIPPDPDKTGT